MSGLTPFAVGSSSRTLALIGVSVWILNPAYSPAPFMSFFFTLFENVFFPLSLHNPIYIYCVCVMPISEYKVFKKFFIIEISRH